MDMSGIIPDVILGRAGVSGNLHRGK